MRQRRPWEVDDVLWERIESLIPKVERRYRNPGRKRQDDRKALNGLLFILYTGMAWEFLPQELGYGSGMTCWRRLREWQRAGAWQKIEELLQAELNTANALDWTRVIFDEAESGVSRVRRARSSGNVSARSVEC